ACAAVRLRGRGAHGRLRAAPAPRRRGGRHPRPRPAHRDHRLLARHRAGHRDGRRARPVPDHRRAGDGGMRLMPTMPHRRRETRAERERGSMHVMTIPVAVGLLTVAVLVVSMLGTATSDRRQAGAAADAAALAATQEWNEHLGLLHALHLTVSEPGAFWGLAEEALLTPSLEREMREAARAYAEDNGAELAALDIDTQRLRVTVRVRHEDAVPG